MPFYRSRITRWTFAGTGTFAAWAFSPDGVTLLRATPPVQWLHQLIPYPLMSAGLILYALLAVYARRGAFQVACILGMGIFATYAAAALWTLAEGFPASAVSLAALLDAVLLHFLALRLAEYDRQGPGS